VATNVALSWSARSLACETTEPSCERRHALIAEVAREPAIRYPAGMDDPSSVPPPREWLDALDRADADVAAGHTVSGEAIVRRLRQTLGTMEARAVDKHPDKVVGRR